MTERGSAAGSRSLWSESQDHLTTGRRTTATTEEAQPMFAPNTSTHQLADSIHQERLAHAARIQQIKQDRSADAVNVDRQLQRRITSRRLAATLAGAVLTFAIAAAVAAQSPAAPAQHPANGGGLTLIR
jgi:hypothetical protein